MHMMVKGVWCFGGAIIKIDHHQHQIVRVYNSPLNITRQMGNMGLIIVLPDSIHHTTSIQMADVYPYHHSRGFHRPYPR